MTTALKEWSAAVHALLDGRQTILLRKGGIHEKRFTLADSRFLFFPTAVHGHAERVRPEHHDLLPRAGADSTEAQVVVRAGAEVVAAIEVGRPRRSKRLPHCISGQQSRSGRTVWTFGPNTVSRCWWCVHTP
ncbi:hypothetical protein I543_2632 [Mycobacteroides abscessus 21]|uniref:DUF1802 family protein n=1 Tax=Mycobacteroides abscessus 21 TaxID=1299324 RepID=A0A829Q5Y3_9MYCO|nr:hypothetical protein I543_2632 [Mycobacteroides abscessus 21]